LPVIAASERSAARLAHRSGGPGVASSNLAAPTILLRRLDLWVARDDSLGLLLSRNGDDVIQIRLRTKFCSAQDPPKEPRACWRTREPEAKAMRSYSELKVNEALWLTFAYLKNTEYCEPNESDC
jgi:hypothetical protein